MEEFIVKETILNKIAKKYDYVSDLVNGFAAVKLNEKWGFIDENGNEICPLKYSVAYGNFYYKEYDMHFFHEGLAAVSLPLGEIITGGGNKYKTLRFGFINTHGEEVCPCTYISVSDFYNGRAYVLDENGSWIINKEFKKITLRGYDEIRNFHYGYAVVKLNNYYGFIDENGKEMCEIQYSYMSSFNEHGFAQIEIPGTKFDRTYWIDTNGKEYFMYFDSNEMQLLN